MKLNTPIPYTNNSPSRSPRPLDAVISGIFQRARRPFRRNSHLHSRTGTGRSPSVRIVSGNVLRRTLQRWRFDSSIHHSVDSQAVCLRHAGLIRSLLSHGTCVTLTGPLHERLREIDLPMGASPVVCFDDPLPASEACEESLLDGGPIRPGGLPASMSRMGLWGSPLDLVPRKWCGVGAAAGGQ